MTNLIFLIVCLLFIFYITYILVGKDLLSPPIVFIGMFIVSTIFAIVNVKNWNIDYSFKAAFLIVTGCIVFAIPSIITYIKLKGYKLSQIDTSIVEIQYWKVALTIILDIIILYLYQKEIQKIANIGGYEGTNYQYFFRESTSYEGTLSVTTSIRMLMKFIDASAYIYAYAFIKNLFILKEKNIRSLLYIIPVILFVVKTLMSGGRLDILKIIAFCIVISYVLTCRKKSWNSLVSMKYIKIGIIIIILGIPTFYSMLSFTGRSTTRTMFESVSTYAGGPIQHFNQFVNDPPEKSDFFGNETLTPILNLLGDYKIIDYHNVVHLEFRQLGVTKGNVYTFFRRLLQDFGYFGMYFCTILVSMFFTIIYYFEIRCSRRSKESSVYILIIYAYLFYWIVFASIEQYSMIIISVQTILTLISIYLLKIFNMNIAIKDMKIYYIRDGLKNIRVRNEKK